MGAQVRVEGVRDAAAEHDHALKVGAGEQRVLVAGEVEVLQPQPGQRAARAESRVQRRQALDLAHEVNLLAVGAEVVAPATVSALTADRVSGR